VTRPIIALFERRVAAELAIGALAGRSFRRDQISLVRRDWGELRDSPDDTGAGLGGLGVLLAGVPSRAIPGIGTVLAAGPLVVAIRRGAPITPMPTAGGELHSALVGIGCTNCVARTYTEGVRRGGTLVAVHAAAGRVVEVRAVLRWACTAAVCSGIPVPPEVEA